MSEQVTAARPYAKAIFELAKKGSNFDAWSDRLKFLSGVVTDKNVAKSLEQPDSTAAERAKMIETIAADKLDAESTNICLLYTSPSPRDKRQSRMPSSA